jgi:hypothetical protein
MTSINKMSYEELKSIRGIELQKMYNAEEKIDKIVNQKTAKGNINIYMRKRNSAIEKLDKVDKEIVKRKGK